MNDGKVSVVIHWCDLGWTNPRGSFDFLTEPEVELQSNERNSLLGWADSTRGNRFVRHWYFVSLSRRFRALLRVTPVGGGERGMASTVQVALLEEKVIGGLRLDLGRICGLFPPAPNDFTSAITERSSQVAITKLGSGSSFPVAVQEGFSILLDRSKSNIEPAIWSIEQSVSDVAEVVLILRLYAMLPRKYKETEFPNFSSSSACRSRNVDLKLSSTASSKPSSASSLLCAVWLQALALFQVGSLESMDISRGVETLCTQLSKHIIDPATETADQFGISQLFSFSKSLESISPELAHKWRQAIEMALRDCATINMERAANCLNEISAANAGNGQRVFAPLWFARMIFDLAITDMCPRNLLDDQIQYLCSNFAKNTRDSLIGKGDQITNLGAAVIDYLGRRPPTEYLSDSDPDIRIAQRRLFAEVLGTQLFSRANIEFSIDRHHWAIDLWLALLVDSDGEGSLPITELAKPFRNNPYAIHHLLVLCRDPVSHLGPVVSKLMWKSGWSPGQITWSDNAFAAAGLADINAALDSLEQNLHDSTHKRNSLFVSKLVIGALRKLASTSARHKELRRGEQVEPC